MTSGIQAADTKYLEDIARQLRKDVISIVGCAKASHVASALSCVDIITALYFKILKIDPKKPYDESRDCFILSKGHGASALYAALAGKGFFDKKFLEKACMDEGHLAGHPVYRSMPGIEATTGSLGHGLPIGAGMAFALKHDKKPARVFVLLGDGECDEGSVWEAALAASHFKLDNLIAIIDYNKLQGFGRTDEVLGLEPFGKKWSSFGWAVEEIDGHNMREIVDVLSRIPKKEKRPTAIIAHTIKGKGVSFMENRLEWHYKPPTHEEMQLAFKELDEI